MWLPMTNHLAAESGIDPSALTQYGVAGLIASIALVTIRWLDNKRTTERDRERDLILTELADAKTRADKLVAEERARADRLEGELARLNTMVQTQVLTALNEATRAVSDAIAAVRASR